MTLSLIVRFLLTLLFLSGSATQGNSQNVHCVFAAEEAGTGYKSFEALKTALGSPGEGNVGHHIVEQSQEGRFGANAIHNTDNVIAIPGQLNRDLNALYSSIRPDITGSNATSRDWLRTKSLEQNYDIGRAVLYYVSTGKW